MPNNFSDICVTCGMCCDGTLFGKAKIKDEKDQTLAETHHLTVIEHQQKTFFELPCPHFDKKCTVYQQNRPHICSAYLCKPLKLVNAGVYSRNKAITLINKALALNVLFGQKQMLFPEFTGQATLAVKQHLFNHKLTPTQQREYRLKYAQLYLIGAKLFPLLNSITSK